MSVETINTMVDAPELMVVFQGAVPPEFESALYENMGGTIQSCVSNDHIKAVFMAMGQTPNKRWSILPLRFPPWLAAPSPLMMARVNHLYAMAAL